MILRWFRIILSAAVFSAVTLYFLDFAGLLPQATSRLMKIQFVPALVGHWEVTLGLLAMVAVLGRFYCSSLCPLGILQDLIAWGARRWQPKKRYVYRPARSWVRWSVFAVFFVALAAPFNVVSGTLDPYGAYGRIATHLFRPLWQAGNNLLAWVSSALGSTTFYYVEVFVQSFFALGIALGTLLLVGILAYRNGRTYCNTICPVGTFFGLLARISLFKIRIREDKCAGCGLCAKTCKGNCINVAARKVDASRCVVCFDCLTACKKDAIGYSLLGIGRKPVEEEAPIQDTLLQETLLQETPIQETPIQEKLVQEKLVQEAPIQETPIQETPIQKTRVQEALLQETADAPTADRRAFLGALSAAAATAALVSTTEAGEKLEEVLTGQVPAGREHPIAPPGALSVFHLKRHCTACHLCVTKCPAQALKPAFLDYGLGGIMVPKLDFTHGFCDFDCTVCGEVCPNDAIAKLTVEEK